MDKRHLRRIKIVQSLYTNFFVVSKSKVIDPVVASINQESAVIDGFINEFAKIHGSEDLAKIDLAILRLAVYELMLEKKTPPKVIINEAVELAHEMGSEKSPSFVNAILGGLFKKYLVKQTTQNE